jgi:hypothetical protein
VTNEHVLYSSRGFAGLNIAMALFEERTGLAVLVNGNGKAGERNVARKVVD